MENINWKKNIIRFLLAQTISLFGSSLVQYAIVWYITLETSSGIMLMISTLCGFLPQIIISIFAGALIDKYNRKKIIIFTDITIALATLLLALIFFMGYKELWILFAVLIVRSSGTGLQTPTVNSIIPTIVPKEKLMKINGINSTLGSLMMFLSPVVSGAILSVATLEVTLLIDVVTAIIGVLVTLTVFIAATNKEDKESSYLNEIKNGFLYLKENKFIRKLLLFQILILFLISSAAFLTPLMIARSFGNEVWRLTASEMVYSLGMILGGILISFWGGFKNKLNTTIIAGAIYGAVMLGLSFAPTFIIYLIFNTLIGTTTPCYNTPLTVTIQEKVPSKMQGRVFSFMQISSSCALPLGMVVFGPLADIVSVELLLMSSGILVIVVTIIAFISFNYKKRIVLKK